MFTKIVRFIHSKIQSMSGHCGGGSGGAGHCG